MKKQSKILVILVVVLSIGFMTCKKSTDVIIPSEGVYAVFAWNDLGMHCLNPSYDEAVILPPYNNVLVQVVKRGSPPEIVTSGVIVEYKLVNNTFSYGKRAYGGFWDNSKKLFGVTLPHDIGLGGNGLSGNMTASGNYFLAEGIPVVPVYDNGVWDPYQVAIISVTNANGDLLAQTRATVPTSDEINCAKCHGPNAFNDILSIHDDSNGTNLISSKPVLCASCHPSPALGINSGPQKYLSQVIHGSHASKTGISCNDCHPGAITKCSRSIAHTSDNGNCVTCHGNMAHVASTIESGRIPWASEPSCISCHTGVSGLGSVTTLYRQTRGHGNLYCSACHGSPHAMIPTNQAADNYQSQQYQGFTSRIKTIGSCGVCHKSSRGENEIGEFAEAHGGTKPEEYIGCSACHTSIPSNTAMWPHAFTWKNSN